MTKHEKVDEDRSVEVLNPLPTSKNALVHGIYSEDVVLPSENKEEFDELQRQYRDEFNPIGAFEEGIVGQITQLQWIKRRLLRTYKVRYGTDQRLRTVLEAVKSGELTLEKLLEDKQFFFESHKVFRQTMNAYKELKKDIAESGLLGQPSAPAPLPPGEQEQKIREVEVAADHMSDPEELDRFLRTLGSLDTRIEKAISRLAGMKEYKKLYVPKQATG
jgi:hypothetical protein